MARRTAGPARRGTVSGLMAFRHRCLDRGRGWCAGVLGVAVWIRTGDPAGVVYRREHGWASQFRLSVYRPGTIYDTLSRAGWVFLAPVVCAIVLGYVVACVCCSASSDGGRHR